MKPALPLDRYKTLLAAYGTRLELWPEAEREAARALLESSAEAREVTRTEASLDASFAKVEAPELSAELAQRLAELPIRYPQPQKLWPFRRVWLPVFGWAAAAALGILLGSSMTTVEPEGSAAVVETGDGALAIESSDEETESDETSELIELALGSVAELEELP